MKDPNRLGRFAISAELVQSGWTKLRPLFENMVVLEADYSYDTRAYHYLALCDHFDEIKEGIPAPNYRLEYICDQDGVISERRWYRESTDKINHPR